MVALRTIPNGPDRSAQLDAILTALLRTPLAPAIRIFGWVGTCEAGRG